jgi:hypothetical protein
MVNLLEWVLTHTAKVQLLMVQKKPQNTRKDKIINKKAIYDFYKSLFLRERS